VTHEDISHLISRPVIEHVPAKLPHPDYTILQRKAPPASTRTVLESRIEALEETLRQAQQREATLEMINEAANAQLIVQNMGMEKLHQTLYEKEKGKKSDRTILFPGGKGRHLTDNEVIHQKRELEEEKKKEELKKANRKEAQVNKRVEKEKLEETGKAMKEEHNVAVERWKETCRTLREGGTLVKDLPKKPRCPLKPKMKDTDDSQESDSSSDGSDN
jgi:hypothetical protein